MVPNSGLTIPLDLEPFWTLPTLGVFLSSLTVAVLYTVMWCSGLIFWYQPKHGKKENFLFCECEGFHKTFYFFSRKFEIFSHFSDNTTSVLRK